MLDITETDERGLRLAGRFDAAQVESAATALGSLSGRCTLDLSELTYISSAGLGLLFATQKRLLDTGGGLRLVNLTPHLREIFRIAGFDRVFELG